MPSKRTFVAFILCSAVIVSVWLINKKPSQSAAITTEPSVSSVKNYINVDTQINDEWKKLLTNVDTQDSKVTDLTAKNNDNFFDETTLTAQLARDFMSQYLLLKKDNTNLTNDQMAQVVQNTLALPAYNQLSGAVYVSSNLNISNDNSPASLKNYQNTANAILQKRALEIKSDPILVINDAIKSNDEKTLEALDPIIDTNKAIIKDFLAISVPSQLVTAHLEIINAFSDFLADLQMMRVMFTDPTRGLIGRTQYAQRVSEFQTAIENMNKYFK